MATPTTATAHALEVRVTAFTQPQPASWCPSGCADTILQPCAVCSCAEPYKRLDSLASPALQCKLNIQGFLAWSAWKLNIQLCDAGKGALKVAAESAKDAAAGKDDEQSPRRADSAGKRPGKRGGRPSKPVWLRGLLGCRPAGSLCSLIAHPSYGLVGLTLLTLDSFKLCVLSCSVLDVLTVGK